MSRVLDVYLFDRLAGKLSQADDGSLSFSYVAEYLDYPDIALSVSMPKREEPYGHAIASPFFSNILPDAQSREILARNLGISEGNSFALLNKIGGECAGALRLMPEGVSLPVAAHEDVETLNEDRLFELLSALPERPLMSGEDNVRISLAGAQNKLALSKIDGRLALVSNSQPTSHILKPAIKDYIGTVENEVFCMKLARRIGLPVPDVDMGQAKTIKYFIIQRYDRETGPDGKIERLHQEDFCQALSVPPELKYEEEGGPGINQCLDVIQKYSLNPAADQRMFLRMIMFHFLVGNEDAHAKNYAFLYHGTASPVLAPLYDVLCTRIYKGLSRRISMSIGRKADPERIRATHWLSHIADTRAAQHLFVTDFTQLIGDMEVEIDGLIEELAAKDIKSPVINQIKDVTRHRARLVEKQFDL